MTHECDDCGQEFDTLTRLRLHDCSPPEGIREDASEPSAPTRATSASADSRSETVALDALDEILDADLTDDVDALYRALATYEGELAAASDADDSERYSEIRRAYRERLVTELDAATQARGWTVLEDAIAAYHPDTAAAFPHVTTVLQNVTGRLLIRTRIADGVAAIPAGALEYFEAIRTAVDEHQDYIREGLHPYGWGIGHPEVDVADAVHAHAATDVFSTNAILEHAFYADQHAAVALLERIARDDAIQQEIAYPRTGSISVTRYLLDAPAGAASDRFWPSIPRGWDWHESLEFEFELDDAVEQRLRDLVTESGLDADLPREWAITDLTL